MSNKEPKIKFRTPRQVYKLWIKALRSGEYKQTRCTLKDNKGFCCLGVLCDLAAKDGGEQWEQEGERFIYGDCSEIPPRDILTYLNLSEDKESTLIQMNDILNKSFKSIANYIEKHYLPLV